MIPQRLYPNPNIQSDLGRVALRRGPLLYCTEAVDNPGGVHALKLPREAVLNEHYEANLLGGVVTLAAEAERDTTAGWDGELYRAAPPASERSALRAIPYFMWDNRDPGDMLVWLRDA